MYTYCWGYLLSKTLGHDISWKNKTDQEMRQSQQNKISYLRCSFLLSFPIKEDLDLPASGDDKQQKVMQWPFIIGWQINCPLALICTFGTDHRRVGSVHAPYTKSQQYKYVMTWHACVFMPMLPSLSTIYCWKPSSEQHLCTTS